MAYDEGRGVTVLFGGYGNSPGYKGDIWEWNGKRWRQVSDDGPSPRFWHAMAYDSRRSVTVLFGGYDGFPRGDTWEWDGTTWTLRSTTGPPPRNEHALAYDSRRGVTVLFGGRSGNQEVADTWEWDGQTWTLRTPSGDSVPSARVGHRLAFDEQRGTVVLFGGRSGDVFNRTYRGDTWEWDGSAWTFRSDSGPIPRWQHAMAYASDRHTVLVYGGYSWPSYSLNDTWEWDGTHWLSLGTGPPWREGHAMVHDRARGVLVLFGGLSGPHPQGDTWEFATCGDTDGDGVPDPDDACPNSDLAETVVIDDCDSGVANHLFDDGCTMADRIGECAEGARNHKAFERCVKHLTKEWVREDLISKQERRAIRRCADRADDDDDDNDDDGEDEDGHDHHARPTKGASTLSVETLGRR